jgi:uncharacterized protein YbaR (Trm112 family)
MDKRLLDILCCPVTKSPVKPLTRAQLDVLNRAIGNGGVRTISNIAVSVPLQAGLITTDGRVIYRIEDDIPVMLADESIGTTQLEALPS